MPYSTDNDLLKEMSVSDLAKLTGDPTGTEINTERTSYARSTADTLIDAYLNGRYQTPLSDPLDPLINKLSIDLTFVNLFEIYYQKSQISQTVTFRKLNAIRMLKDIREGIVHINAKTSSDVRPPIILSNKEGKPRTFPEDLLNKFDD